MTPALEQRPDRIVPTSSARGPADILFFPARSDSPMVDSHFNAAPIALCTINRQKRFEAVNARMARILGPAPAHLLGSSASDILPGAEVTLDRYFTLADAGEPLKDQDISWQGRRYQLSFEPIVNEGRVVGLSVAANDVSRRARIEQRLRKSRRHLRNKASHDYLTGLLNRRGLETKLHREIRRARRKEEHIAILVVDIDHFKAYNDHFGHVAGDECLRAVASALRSCVRRGGDAAGRYGGEEFVLILPETDRAGAAAIAESCRQAVNHLNLPHPASKYGHLTVSIGVASIRPDRTAPAMPAEAATLMKAADEALYLAKAQGRNRVSLG